jgi:BirA family biotin operon repressor/biotin-[acetyl-CoA-carboxylase] ligase
VTASTDPLIDRDRLLSALGAEADRFSLDLRTQCDSSNTMLAAAPARDDGRTAVLVCDAQTAGRGRRGRTWLAWPGGSLTFSARWRFDADAPVPAGLSLVAGLSVVQALEALQVPSLELKWPNDIQIHGKKLGGILVELSRTGAHLDAVVGIGLNLRFPPDAGVPERTDVVALADVVDPVPPAEHMLASILVRLQQLLDAYARSGFAPFVAAWNQRNAYADLPVVLSGEAESLAGICLGVDDDGALRVRTDEGVRRVLAGDISLRKAS